MPPKATDHNATLQPPNIGTLGPLRPFAIMAYRPTQPFPGVHDIDARRRLLAHHLGITHRGAAVPVTLAELNQAHVALRDHWDGHAASAGVPDGTAIWDLTTTRPEEFNALFAGFVRRYPERAQ